MMTPIHFANGVIYDGRSIILAIAGLFLGPAGAVPAVVIAVAYRLALGGTGAIIGTLVIVESAVLGVIVHFLRSRDERWVRPLRLFLFGLIVHVGMALLQLFLPGGLRYIFFHSVIFEILVVMPTGTFLIAQLFLSREHKAQADQRLRESEARYRSLFMVDHAVMLVIDPESRRIMDANPAAAEYYGRSIEVLKSMLITDINQLSPEEVKQRIREARTAQNDAFEFPHRRADGSVRDVEVLTGTVITNGKPLLFSIIQDISARKRAERALKEALHEKDVLIQEVHHRVKNNLATVAALINIQIGQIQTPAEAIEGLERTRDRMVTMGHVHNLLYTSDTSSRLDFGSYLRKLIDGIAENYQRADNIHLEIPADPVVLDIARAIPAGLIVNELVTNAIKHATGENASGRITVVLQYRASDGVKISIADDGPGIPARIFEDDRGTSGIHLVEILVQQIEGTLNWDVDAGTRVDLEFETV
jgi:PAS domain S-box-containing protein